MLKSRTVPIHLLRGVLGLGFLLITLHYAGTLGWWALVPGAAALACFRGCPLCWTLGLVETVLSRHIDCPDGSCAKSWIPHPEK